MQSFTHSKIETLFAHKLEADKDTRYTKELYLNLSTVPRYVSGPNSVKIARPLHELAHQNIRMDKCYLVSCTNSRASDFAAAAKVFKDVAKQNDGRIPKVADGVSFYIAAASKREQEAAEAAGDWEVLLKGGAEPLPSGCGPCISPGTGLLQPRETGISASNRNFSGRMGSVDAKCYLASPEVVSSSALSGRISGAPSQEPLESGHRVVKFGYGDGAKEGD